MLSFSHVKSVAKTQLFAKLPRQDKKSFAEKTYRINMERFSVQCLVLVFMDLAYLLLYMGINGSSFSTVHVTTVSVKIVLMIIGYFYFTHISKLPYESKNCIRKNMDIIYPFIHFILEFSLFFTGTKGIGSLLRLSAVPFICGSIPIIKQSKTLVMGL